MTPMPRPVAARSQRALDGSWSFRRAGEQQWLPAQVPGSNFTDLHRAGLTEDPFADDAEKRLQWIEQVDWEYRCLFDVAAHDLHAPSLELRFDGLDTLCTVWLNGTAILTADNMFREWRVEARELLRPGANELLLRFASPVTFGAGRRADTGFLYPAENDQTPDKASVHVRKAPYHFGWDWGPKYVASGVSRPVWLDVAQGARLRDANWRIIALDDAVATVAFTVEVEALAAGSATLGLRCDVPGVADVRRQCTLVPGTNRVEIALTIEEPRRWWPNGLGEAFLYPVEIALDAVDGAWSDRLRRRVGLRTVRVVHAPDAIGTSFHVEVNGEPVFMKGANYIPPDSFMERMTPDRYARLFRDVVDANMNMLRVWGGGVYETDLFYDLADEHGILIWQDFMFACTLYPHDAAFLANVEAEAIDQVRRLRHHSCVALWCGNNEISLGIAHWEWPAKFGYSADHYRTLVAGNDRLFAQLLDEVVRRHDPDRFYMASSPIGFWNDPADDDRGDSHYWGVWHGELPFASYAERIPRFMSEYGFQSYPIASSVARFVPDGQRHIGSPGLLAHQKHPRGDAIITRFVRETYGEPVDFDGFCYLSQLTQAHALKIAFEAHRRNMPRCMGSLYWQLADCWPAVSWSSIDYYGQWKALHYQAARSFAPVMLSIEPLEGGALRLHVVSDAAALAGRLEVEAIDVASGAVAWRTSRDVAVPRNAARVAGDVTPAVDGAGFVLHSRLVLADGTIAARDVRLLADPVACRLPDPRLTIDAPGEASVAVTAVGFAHAVHLEARRQDGEGAVVFSDNFFDLLPGETRVVDIRHGAMMEVASLTVRSARDAVKHAR